MTVLSYVLSHGFRYPVVAKGILYWIRDTVTDPKYFVHNTDHTPVHLILLDEVGHLCIVSYSARVALATTPSY